MFKIRLENFQAVKSAELEVKGLTVLTGQNNGGKSVMVRAFKGLVTNSAAKSYVRNGEKTLSVRLSFDDGNDVLWEKGGTVNQYTVNGKTLTGVGSSAPDEVKALNIIPVEAGGQTLWPQIAPAFEGPLFLIDKSPAVFAEAVSDTERVGVLADATRAAESDIRSDKAEIKVRKKDLMAAEDRLARYSQVSSLDPYIERIKKSSEELVKIKNGFQKINRWKDTREAQSRIVMSLQGVEGISINPLQDLSDILHLSNLRNRYDRSSKDVSRFSEVVIPELNGFDYSLIDLSKKMAHLKRATSFDIPDIADIPDTEKFFRFTSIYLNFREAQNKVADVDRDAEALESEMAELIDDLKSVMEQLGNCPTCGGDWHAETSLAH